MTKHKVIFCNICNKPLYPIQLKNDDRDTWCVCYKPGIPLGWSGYVEKSYKKKWK